jgi:hypothetical protein
MSIAFAISNPILLLESIAATLSVPSTSEEEAFVHDRRKGQGIK